ncbi:hypothetical protein T440DRAFT_262654 [Plenodomus tracheiphilus IPT5]|uniref:Uncharacterized protein n=1 Tax=Plenodomus tracheiphilus IPT5 TaxID=1408161 RepID=A0A6A7AQJ8_9PLEO|nr:hypothetical protein T440DRAFT_262654 [Plenodomus tracheiphilus IPT5]
MKVHGSHAAPAKSESGFFIGVAAFPVPAWAPARLRGTAGRAANHVFVSRRPGKVGVARLAGARHHPPWPPPPPPSSIYLYSASSSTATGVVVRGCSGHCTPEGQWSSRHHPCGTRDEWTSPVHQGPTIQHRDAMCLGCFGCFGYAVALWSSSPSSHSQCSRTAGRIWSTPPRPRAPRTLQRCAGDRGPPEATGLASHGRAGRPTLPNPTTTERGSAINLLFLFGRHALSSGS